MMMDGLSGFSGATDSVRSSVGRLPVPHIPRQNSKNVMTWASNFPGNAIKEQIYILLVAALFVCGGCKALDAQSGGDKNERRSRVSTELTSLYHEYSTYVRSRQAGSFKSSSPIVQVVDDRVLVDAVASGDVNVLKSDLESLGMQHAVAYGRIVSGQLPILAIPQLEMLRSLNSAKAASAVLQGGPGSVSPGTLNP
jgi:hypothetical protein